MIYLIKEKLGLILPLVFIILILVMLIYGKSEYKTKINALTSMNPQHVTTFKIYSRVAGRPYRTPVTFNAPDPLIEEFFHALTDRRSYPTSRDTAKVEQQWFLEVATGEIMIQIAFYIPYKKGDIVVGIIGNFSETGGSYDGDFQSRKLFQWYQKYSHRWLSPPAAQEEEDEKVRR